MNKWHPHDRRKVAPPIDGVRCIIDVRFPVKYSRSHVRRGGGTPRIETVSSGCTGERGGLIQNSCGKVSPPSVNSRNGLSAEEIDGNSETRESACSLTAVMIIISSSA
ncbi:Hypothetical protein NTJ_07691 [Nesidiocoris tenuis]|uniref:Rhodanese domain-containing protein n=1 Tax=Nesidiocoris tenuis TaxID=355587 RepID=A0ABN7AWN4_9HEMI|nr:Hypothetical protein NTJ_07691 [Nesidiocoris tenuis]